MRLRHLSRNESVEALPGDLRLHVAGVSNAGWLEQDELDLPERDHPVLDAAANDAELAPLKRRHGAALVNLELPLEHPEHLVLGPVRMPRDLVALEAHELDVLTVELADDLRREGVVEHRKVLLDIHHQRHGDLRSPQRGSTLTACRSARFAWRGDPPGAPSASGHSLPRLPLGSR